MKTLPAAWLFPGLICASPAWAGSGDIAGFVASATTVRQGDTVDFFATFSVATSGWSYGGSDPVEPAPDDGFQTWHINWYAYENETLSGVWLDAAGQTFADSPVTAPGGVHNGGWSFSVLFPSAGTFDIVLHGGWTALTESYSSNESASRDCTRDDGGELYCSGWTYDYADFSDNYVSDGTFTDRTLTITVLAVPEPLTLSLWLAGIGVLAAVHGHRRPA
jgi:hypothetical protein